MKTYKQLLEEQKLFKTNTKSYKIEIIRGYDPTNTIDIEVLDKSKNSLVKQVLNKYSWDAEVNYVKSNNSFNVSVKNDMSLAAIYNELNIKESPKFLKSLRLKDRMKTGKSYKEYDE